MQCSGIHEPSHKYNNQVTHKYKYQVTITTYRNQGPSTCVEDWNIGKSKNVLNKTDLALKNGETYLWTYSKFKKIVVLIFIIDFDFCFFVIIIVRLSGMFFRTTEQKLLT